MRKIKEVLRLHLEAGLSERKISKICVLGKERYDVSCNGRNGRD